MLLSPDLKFKLTARGEMEKYKVRVLFTNKCRVNNAIVFFFLLVYLDPIYTYRKQ